VLFGTQVDHIKVARNEHGFISAVAAPLWEKIFLMYTSLTPQQQNLACNLKKWNDIASGDIAFPDETAGKEIVSIKSSLSLLPSTVARSELRSRDVTTPRTLLRQVD